MFISFLIAIGLNFDTFSVAVVEGAEDSKPSIRDSLKVGIFFGAGQALMALLGNYLGLSFKLVITNIDHWIAFILLSVIGGKMIYESMKGDHCQKRNNILEIRSLLLLVVATSIDALVVGITLAFINSTIFTNIIMIGIVTFFVSFVGYYAGEVLRKYCKSKIKVIGGLILIIIGIKILIQHLFLGG
jgi:manganese efflux pump family protein